MFEQIRKFFIKEELTEPAEDFVLEVPRNQPTDTTFYYLNMYLARLNKRFNYMLMEELKDGTVITHLEDAPYEEMKDYCRMVWIPSHPAKFIVVPNV